MLALLAEKLGSAVQRRPIIELSEASPSESSPSLERVVSGRLSDVLVVIVVAFTCSSVAHVTCACTIGRRAKFAELC